MIKIDAQDVSASVREFDSTLFVQQLKDWQQEDSRKIVTYILDEVFDLFVDCCEFD